jgi:hypothetical protein
VKHAGAAALDRIGTALEKLRHLPGVVEKKRGVFYRGSAAFVHFHEDPAGVFADLKQPGGWKRYCVTRPPERRAFLAAARQAVRRA